MSTLAIQRRLVALGYDPGPLDGVRGRLTTGAVRRFQADHGLAADGIAGPKTRAELFPGVRHPTPNPSPQGGGERATPRRPPPWMVEALRLKGTREAGGVADNPLILAWAKRLGLAYAHDATAWCGLFAAHCIGVSLPEEELPDNPLAARSWLRFGREAKPRPGAVLVFWRGTRSGWQGHIGFHAGEDETAFHVLGGNPVGRGDDRAHRADAAPRRALAANLSDGRGCPGSSHGRARSRAFHQRGMSGGSASRPLTHLTETAKEKPCSPQSTRR